MKSEFYFQYDEIGNPLFYFEFMPEFNYTFFTTSFLRNNTEVHFERSIAYPVSCRIEKKIPCKKLFFDLLDLDSQRYIHYIDSLEHDFISPHYIKNKQIDFNLFNSERHIIKKLQNNGIFRSEEYANSVLSKSLNLLGKEKFESLMQSKLQAITKHDFFEGLFEKASTISFLTKGDFFMVRVGAYSLFIQQDTNKKFSCWLKK